MKTKKIMEAIFVLLSLFFGQLTANATIVTINIQAVVDSVADPGNYLEGKIQQGSIINGYYIYDSATPDSNPSLNVGDYFHTATPYGIFLTAGGFEFKTNPLNVNFLVEVVNAGESYYSDYYLLRSYYNSPLSNGVIVRHIYWQLEDPTGNAILNDALPLTSPILSDWQSSLSVFRIQGEKDIYTIDAHVISATPEPATLFLLGMGAVFIRRRRINQKT